MIQLIEVPALQFRSQHSKRTITLALLGLMLFPALKALAAEGFGGDWQPKPLVDTTAPSSLKPPALAAGPQAAPAAPPVQPDLEAKLKPVEPFIREIENHLALKPKPGVTMVQRLNTLQAVLFGAQKYQDAGELISKLAEVFPQEAQKAQAELEKQYQSTMQANAAPGSGQAGKPNVLQNTAQARMKTPMAITQSAPPATSKKKRSLWGSDDFNSDFDNDPFFQDTFKGRVKTSTTQGGVTTQSMTSQNGFSQQPYSSQPYGAQTNMQQPNGPSRLATMAQGLGGLALAVGGIAGAYYLNNKMSGGNRAYGHNNYNNYGYPNNGYGYNGVSPYGAGVSPYGSPGAYPAYPYAGATMTPYGTGITPYGMAPNTISPYAGSTYNYNGTTYGGGAPVYRNYSGPGFSGSAFGASGSNISPLGVPGF